MAFNSLPFDNPDDKILTENTKEIISKISPNIALFPHVKCILRLKLFPGLRNQR
jgi:hypothetical protein